MAFDLKDNNSSGVAVITDTSAELRQLPENFITDYDYAMQYMPELIKDIAFANGKGSILGFLRATTSNTEGSFESDMIQHSELKRLTQPLSVTATGNNFTSTVPHMLEERYVVKMSDGDQEYQGVVTSTPTPTTFTVLSDKAAFTFNATSLTLLPDFSNRSQKGDDAFKKARKWNPTIYTNHAHIVKSFYEVSDSDLAHKTWIDTPDGPRWYNLEMNRNFTLHDNKIELTGIFHERALDDAPSTLAGYAQGLNGVVPQVESRGNVSNDLITTQQDLSNLAKRAKRQGTCREFSIWCDHDQMAAIRLLCAGLNAAFIGGSHYGAFNNSKEMALNLDFVSVLIDGVQFHFASWALLDDPTLLAAVNFDVTSLAFLMVPSGNTYVMENGNTVSKPYITLRYRTNNVVNRRRQIKWFGVLGTQVMEDKSGCEVLTEMTIQVVAANNYFVGRKSEFYA